jgi:hypothetical protein
MIIVVVMVFLFFKILLFLLPNGLGWNIWVLGGFLYYFMGPFQCHQNSPIGGLNFTKALIPCDAPPHSLKYSNVSLEMEIMEEEGVGVRSLIRSTLRVEGHVAALGWGLR